MLIVIWAYMLLGRTKSGHAWQEKAREVVIYSDDGKKACCLYQLSSCGGLCLVARFSSVVTSVPRRPPLLLASHYEQQPAAPVPPKIPHMPSSKDQKTLNRATLGGTGRKDPVSRSKCFGLARVRTCMPPTQRNVDKRSP